MPGRGLRSIASTTTLGLSLINVGSDGNTNQASKSPAEYLLVTSPDGGEVWPAGQTFTIRWRTNQFVGNVNIELWQAGGTSPVTVIATGTQNDGEYSWTIPNSIAPANNYRVRISQSDNASIVDDSNVNFQITGISI